MILLRIQRRNGHQLFFRLRDDKDLKVVEQVTDRLKVYLEDAEFSFVPMEGGDSSLAR